MAKQVNAGPLPNMDKAQAIKITVAGTLLAGMATATYLQWQHTTTPPTAQVPASTQAQASLQYTARESWPTNPGVLPLTDTTYQAVEEQLASGGKVYLSEAGDQASYITNNTIATTALMTGQAGPLTQAPTPATVVEYPTSKAALQTLQEETRTNTPTWQVAALVLTATTLAYVVARRKITAAATAGVKTGSNTKTTDIPTTTFADIAGVDEAVEDLTEIVEFLRNPDKYTKLGANAPSGALLIGPPGTGKTMLARAVAGEAGVAFFATSGSDYVEKYVGVGASRVRDLFKKARKAKDGAIIFIDEVDAVGRARGADNHSETENTLNALLVEMDGFTQTKIIVLAATNRPDMLDKALTRPGRLDRQVHVPLPDRAGRLAILNIHTQNKPLDPQLNLEGIAARSTGMSGAELGNIVNEACINAARKNQDVVTNEDFEHALALTTMGKARSSAVVTDADREITAWHEAGHAVAALLHPHSGNPASVSIVPRGHAGGVTWTTPEEDTFLTLSRAQARLVVAMAGRAAEEVVLNGEYTSGASGDLATATSLAHAMITRYGMGGAGLAVHDEGLFGRSGREVKEQVDEVLAEALSQARQLVTTHRSAVAAVAEKLLEHETLTGVQVAEAVSRAEAGRVDNFEEAAQ